MHITILAQRLRSTV